MVNYRRHFSRYEKNRWTGLTISLCIVVIFYMVLTHVDSLRGFFDSFLNITSTVIIGAIIAYIVNPLAVFIYEKLRKVFKRKENAAWALSASTSLILVLVIFVVLIAIITPMLIENINNFALGLSGYMNSLKGLIINSTMDQEFKNAAIDFINEQSNFTAVVRRYVLGNDLTPTGVINLSKNIGAGALNLFIGIILSFYFLIGKKKLVELLSEFFYLVIPTQHYENLSNIWKRFNNIFSRFVICELIDSLIVGVANAIFMFAMHMPYAVFCSVVIALANIAPTFGPFVGAFICAVILLLAKPEFVIPFLVFSLVIQLIDGYFIKPRLFGTALKVPAFLILVFLVVGGKLWGAPGVLLAIPVAAILSYIYEDIVVPWLKLRKKTKDEDDADEEAIDEARRRARSNKYRQQNVQQNNQPSAQENKQQNKQHSKQHNKKGNRDNKNNS